jgi:hypothetical protein
MDLSPETRAALRLRRAELAREREYLLAEANGRVGAIAEIDRMLAEPPPAAEPAATTTAET